MTTFQKDHALTMTASANVFDHEVARYEGLAATCTQLKHLLLVRDLRRLRS